MVTLCHICNVIMICSSTPWCNVYQKLVCRTSVMGLIQLEPPKNIKHTNYTDTNPTYHVIITM